MQPVMIVTGGSQGIGAAVAVLAGSRGYAVALTWQSNKLLADNVVSAINAAGGRAIAVQAEMADEASILAFVSHRGRNVWAGDGVGEQCRRARADVQTG